MPDLRDMANDPVETATQTPAVTASADGGAAVGGSAATTPTAGQSNPAAAADLGNGSQNQAGTAAQATAQQTANFRDILRQSGVDFGQLDDASAARQLAQLWQSLPAIRRAAQIGEQVYPHLSEFQKWQAQQQQAAQAEAAKKQEWWKKPEFDPSWEAKLTRDPATGQLKVVDGADPTILQKYLAYADHERSFLRKLSIDPMEAIGPGIKGMVEQMLQPALQEAIRAQEEKQRAQQVVQQHADWLYENTPTGPQLSVWGQRYAQYEQQATQLGIRGVEQAHNYAYSMVERDFLAAQQRAAQTQQQQVATGAQAKNDFVNGARHVPGTAAGPGVVGSPAAPPPMKSERDLYARMMQNMNAGGFQPHQELVGR